MTGNEIDRRRVGTGTASVRLFKGVYIAEGVYEDTHRKQSVQIKPDAAKNAIYLELPPILRHSPSSRVSVGEVIPIALDLTSHEPPERVQISYIIFDKHGVDLKRDNEEYAFVGRATYIVDMDLSSQIYQHKSILVGLPISSCVTEEGHQKVSTMNSQLLTRMYQKSI